MNLENELLAVRQERGELSSKLIEMRNEKALIASKLRSKEEEIENQLEKTSEIRQQLRDAERLKRQHLESIINLETELDKEKQLRKENQYEIKELEEKMVVVEEQLINYQSINAMKEDDKFEQENSYVEQISELKYQLNEKLHNLNEKQEFIKELQHKLIETDQRLMEQEKLIGLNQQQECRIKELESELDELKSLQPNWEKQISEIISWLGSEKEARSYLQEIANNMTKELDHLKQQKQFNQYSNVPRYNADRYATLLNRSNLINDSLNKSQQESNYSTITWQERRSARVDKQELLQLQLELKNEIEDKQRVQGELVRLQREMNGVMSELNESKNELQRLKQQKQKHDSQKSLNQFQLGSATNALQSQVQLRNSNLMSGGTNSNRQSLNLNNGSSILYQAQKDLQQKINAIQLSPLPTADFSDMDLQSPASSPTSDNYPNSQMNNNKLASYSQMKNGDDNNHSFLIRSFVFPLKCFQCTSLMVGLVRQGLVCEVCGFACHVACANPNAQLSSYMTNSASQLAIMENSNNNPIPACPYDDSRQRPIGIDPIRGKGSAYEGYLKINTGRIKAKGVKKGWTRMFVVVCDFKLFLYDLTATATDLGSNALSNHGNSNSMMSNSGFGTLSNNNYNSNFSSTGDSVSYFNSPFVSVNTLIDMRDEQFSVSGVSEQECIHANKKDIPCIFKVCTSMLTELVDNNSNASQQSNVFGEDAQQDNPHKEQKSQFTQLMMVDRESERNKWIEALHELHRILRKNKLSNRNTLKSYKLLNSVQLPMLRNFSNINCCCLIDETRILLGTEDGLVCCDLDIQVYRKIVKTNKVLLAEYSPTDQLIVVLSGKQRKVKLLPTKGLDHSDTDWVRLEETKGANLMKVCTQPQNNITLVCVAMKKTLAIYEIVRKKSRYCAYREIQSALNITNLCSHQNGELIGIGSNSNFIVYHLTNREYPPLYLVNQECSQLNYLIQNSIEALCCFQVSDKEWLLLFAHYGVYVDYQGRRSRQVSFCFCRRKIRSILNSMDHFHLPSHIRLNYNYQRNHAMWPHFKHNWPTAH